MSVETVFEGYLKISGRFNVRVQQIRYCLLENY